MEQNNEPEVIGDYGFGKTFSKYREYLSDVCDVDYTCGFPELEGFGRHGEVFNDNITLRIISPKEMHKVDAVYARAAIRDKFGGACVMRGDNGRGHSLRFLVSPTGLTVGEVLRRLRELLTKYKRLKLCDIDFTIDCERITTRKSIISWLPAGTKIADKSNVTGNNCISWFEDDGNRRCKGYNKPVQIKECAGVREKIGSSLHVLLTDTEVASTALRYKDVGMTRLEITFYGESVLSERYYADTVLGLYERMKTCKTYSVSLEDQWNALESKITQMMCIYHLPSKTFAYCHWWNSLTGKIQGGSSQIKESDLLKVISYYAYINRPIYLLKVKDGNHEDEIVVYRRNNLNSIGGSIITLLPGPQGGLYANGKTGIHVLSDFGMGSMDPGFLGWKDGLRSTSREFPGLIEETSMQDELDALINSMNQITINTRDYVAASKILEMDKEYMVIGYGREEFQGKIRIFARMSDGTCVRCEKDLTAAIEAREVSGNNTPLKFRTIKTVKAGNVRNTHISVIDE